MSSLSSSVGKSCGDGGCDAGVAMSAAVAEDAGAVSGKEGGMVGCCCSAWTAVVGAVMSEG